MTTELKLDVGFRYVCIHLPSLRSALTYGKVDHGLGLLYPLCSHPATRGWHNTQNWTTAVHILHCH